MLQKADRGHLQAALSTFAGKPTAAWLGHGHPGGLGTLPKTWPRVRGLPATQVVEALAVSAPNHCIDGWGFSARAMSGLLSGDAHGARHLAYYGQLRSALSILANVGVGIFNRINFAVDSAGGIHKLDQRGDLMGTHAAVWAALREWVTAPKTARVFLEMIRIRGTSLKECVELIWPGVALNTVAARLVAAWGVDLKRGKSEHGFRNQSSYAPQLLMPVTAPTKDMLSFIDGVWRHLEPSGGASFDSIDRFLLRSVFWEQHYAMTGNRDYATGPIVARYDQLPHAIRSIASLAFLTGEQEAALPDLFARAIDPVGGPLEMTARTVLLCRVATAFTHTNFTEAGVGVTQGALRPWLNELAEIRGFWPPNAPLADPVELWADVELALLELDVSRVPDPTCLNDWLTKNSKGLPVLAEAERVGVWSFS